MVLLAMLPSNHPPHAVNERCTSRCTRNLERYRSGSFQGVATSAWPSGGAVPGSRNPIIASQYIHAKPLNAGRVTTATMHHCSFWREDDASLITPVTRSGWRGEQEQFKFAEPLSAALYRQPYGRC